MGKSTNKWVVAFATASIFSLAACNAPRKEEAKVDAQDALAPNAAAPAQNDVSTPLPNPVPPKSTLLGKWVPFGGKCAVADGDEFLEITPDGISGYESGCKVRPSIKSGSNYEGKSICFDQTEMMDMPASSLTLQLKDNDHLIKVEDGQRSEWKRCQ